MKALRTNPKAARDEDGAGGGDSANETGGVPKKAVMSGGEGSESEGATPAAKAKRGTRRKNQERKIL